MTPPVERFLLVQTDAARGLLAALRSADADDDAEVVASAIEGETGLIEAVEEALSEIDEFEIHIIGLKAKEAEFASRRFAMETRVERIRAAIERAMLETEQMSLRLAGGTITLAKRAPGAVIEDEAALPSRFFVQPPAPPPKLDKKALNEALRAGEEVPGAHLDNGSVSLSIRRK